MIQMVSKTFGFHLVREITIGGFHYTMFVEKLARKIQRHSFLSRLQRLWCLVSFSLKEENAKLSMHPPIIGDEKKILKKFIINMYVASI